MAHISGKQSFILGVRQSPMAKASADLVAPLLRQNCPDLDVQIESFLSYGDTFMGDLRNSVGKSAFIKDLEKRLLNREIDAAVHTLKDVPGDTPMHEDLMLACFLPRDDPRDCLVLRQDFDPQQPIRVIGTSAPRRRAIVRHLFKDASVELCRGNVNTRLKKLDNGQYDALLLSSAGLARIGFADRISKIYDRDEILPAIGQGIVCVQIRREDFEKFAFLQNINDPRARNAATAERKILEVLDADCFSAIAAHCYYEDKDTIALRACVYGQGTEVISAYKAMSVSEVDFDALGLDVAQILVDQGAKQLLNTAQ